MRLNKLKPAVIIFALLALVVAFEILPSRWRDNLAAVVLRSRIIGEKKIELPQPIQAPERSGPAPRQPGSLSDEAILALMKQDSTGDDSFDSWLVEHQSLPKLYPYFETNRSLEAMTSVCGSNLITNRRLSPMCASIFANRNPDQAEAGCQWLIEREPYASRPQADKEEFKKECQVGLPRFVW